MKSISFFTMLALSGILLFGACGKDEVAATTGTSVVPAENFTIYTGEYVYTNAAGVVITETSAKATVKDLGGNKLQITFNPANAPTLSVTMKKDANTFVNTDFSNQMGITFSSSELNIGVNSSSPVYVLAFSGSR